MRQGQYLLMFVFKVLLQFRSTNTSCLTVRDVFKILIDQLLALIGRTGGGGCARKSVVQSAFQNGEQSVHRRDV